jgi:NADH dehydrogenase
MRKQILMIGGAGFVGQAIAHELGKNHDRVLIPTRQKAHLENLKTNPFVEIVESESYTSEALIKWMKRIGPEGIVINLAGILHDRQGKPYGPKFKATHVDLTKTIVEAMKSTGLKRYLHMSALGASEDGPSMYSRSKGEAENIVKNSGLAWTIFRPSVIFGEKDQFINLFAKLQKFAPIMPLAGANVLFQPVNVNDVAKAFVKSVDMTQTIHQVYDLGGPKTYTLSQIVQLAGKKMGCQRRVIALPEWAGYLQAFLLEFAPGPTLMSRDNLASMRQNNILDAKTPNCLKEIFGIEPKSLESLIV